jgi:hypothetical protein
MAMADITRHRAEDEQPIWRILPRDEEWIRQAQGCAEASEIETQLRAVAWHEFRQALRRIFGDAVARYRHRRDFNLGRDPVSSPVGGPDSAPIGTDGA